MTAQRRQVRPWTAEDDQTLLDYYASGYSLHATATEMKRSKRMIHEKAKLLGVSWSGTVPRMEAATRAKVAHGKARREELKRLLLEDAHKLRAEIWQPALYFDWGGKDHEYDEREVDQPTYADKLKLMQATQTAINTYGRLDQMDADNGAAEARSMLERLAESMGVQGPELSA